MCHPVCYCKKLAKVNKISLPLPDDVEDAGPEEGEGEEDEEAVGGFAAAVLADQLTTLSDQSKQMWPMEILSSRKFEVFGTELGRFTIKFLPSAQP